MKQGQININITRTVKRRLNKLRKISDRSYTEVIKQLLIDTGQWNIKEEMKLH